MHFRHAPRITALGEPGRGSRKQTMLILAVPALSLVVPALAVEIASAGGTGQLTRIAAAVAKFLLFYSGVFALIALSAAVAAGLLATDRAVMSPERRILAQALHRTMSLIGVSALANHIMLEIMARRASLADGFVPFMAARSTFYMGLGTLASDLFIVIIVTGILRRRFAGRAGRWIWRSLHATAYAAWPLAILHGLLAGRSAKPYVDWSYGGCLAAVALALTFRYIAAIRGRAAVPAAAGAGGARTRHRLAAMPYPGIAQQDALTQYGTGQYDGYGTAQYDRYGTAQYDGYGTGQYDPAEQYGMRAPRAPRALPPPRPAPTWYDPIGHPAGQDRQ